MATRLTTTLSSSDLADLLAAVREISGHASRLVLDCYHRDLLVTTKPDGSPTTSADLAAEQLIIRELTRLTPSVAVVAEESYALTFSPSAVDRRFWLVDPIDNTRGFIAHRGLFTVNIALIDDGQPILGVIDVPFSGEQFSGALNIGAFRGRQPLNPRRQTPAPSSRPPTEGLRVLLSSRDHDSESLKDWLATQRSALGRESVLSLDYRGSSWKFCAVASGEADCYPRWSRTHEWDTAAGHAIVWAAGGQVVTLADGQPLGYGKPAMLNPPYVAWSPRQCAEHS